MGVGRELLPGGGVSASRGPWRPLSTTAACPSSHPALPALCLRREGSKGQDGASPSLGWPGPHPGPSPVAQSPPICSSQSPGAPTCVPILTGTPAPPPRSAQVPSEQKGPGPPGPGLRSPGSPRRRPQPRGAAPRPPGGFETPRGSAPWPALAADWPRPRSAAAPGIRLARALAAGMLPSDWLAAPFVLGPRPGGRSRAPPLCLRGLRPAARPSGFGREARGRELGRAPRPWVSDTASVSPRSAPTLWTLEDPGGGDRPGYTSRSSCDEAASRLPWGIQTSPFGKPSPTFWRPQGSPARAPLGSLAADLTGPPSLAGSPPVGSLWLCPSLRHGWVTPPTPLC